MPLGTGALFSANSYLGEMASATSIRKPLFAFISFSHSYSDRLMIFFKNLAAENSALVILPCWGLLFPFFL